MSTEVKASEFNKAMSFILERTNNGIRDGQNDSELNSLISIFKTGDEAAKASLADRAAYYAELARAKRESTLPSQSPSPIPVLNPSPHGGQVNSAKLTGYYPANNAMEGGFVDRFGHKLYTLQDFLEGSAPYVSVAADKPLSSKNNQPYIRIPSIEAKYGMKIPFKICDTGSAFFGKGTSRLDICTRSMEHSVREEVNASGVEWYYDAT